MTRAGQVTRAILAVLALAGIGWGAVLIAQLAQRSWPDGRSVLGWLIGGPILHDAVLAPLVGVAGLLIGRRLSPPWRVPVVVGAAVSGVLTLLAVPLLWRAYVPAVNPGLDDRDYRTGLLVWLAAVWFVVALVGLARTWPARRQRGDGRG